MQKLFIIILSSFFMLSAYSQVSTCEQEYLDAAKVKNERLYNDFMGPAVIAPAVVLGILNPIAGASYFVISNLAAFKITQNRSQIAVEDLLHSQATMRFQRLVRKAKRRDPSITKEDISRIISNGFISGDFCAEEKLLTPRQIQKKILADISNR